MYVFKTPSISSSAGSRIHNVDSDSASLDYSCISSTRSSTCATLSLSLSISLELSLTRDYSRVERGVGYHDTLPWNCGVRE
mmetsp:Transcript_35305/g.71523  ORF Transcript_35305/g.71523 Transcript_35305/m.71523 type:complete len:81 (+) Transcript_35305:97-339(+)